MTQEEKELLLKDLCARLPYGVKYCRDSWNYEWDQEMSAVEVLEDIDKEGYINYHKVYKVDDIKPYLRPMSSMTEEEREDFWRNVLDMDWKEEVDCGYGDDDELETAPFPFVENGCGFYLDYFYLRDTFAVIDWLNEHHFDYRGLIPMSLALEAPKDMYKTHKIACDNCENNQYCSQSKYVKKNCYKL